MFCPEPLCRNFAVTKEAHSVKALFRQPDAAVLIGNVVRESCEGHLMPASHDLVGGGTYTVRIHLDCLRLNTPPFDCHPLDQRSSETQSIRLDGGQLINVHQLGRGAHLEGFHTGYRPGLFPMVTVSMRHLSVLIVESGGGRNSAGRAW